MRLRFNRAFYFQIDSSRHVRYGRGIHNHVPDDHALAAIGAGAADPTRPSEEGTI